MSDLFGNYQSQDSRSLARIDSSKYPDTNKDFEANIRRLNGFVDYISQYLQQMQKGVDQANTDPITQFRDVLQDMGALLSGGQLLSDIDLGDLQYFFPAFAAMFGFNNGEPFPLNLLYAAEHFLLGYIIPLDSFSFVINDMIEGWAEIFGLSPEFIEAIQAIVTAVGGVVSDVFGIFSTLLDFLGIFGIDTSGDGMGPFGDIWHVITKLMGGFSLKSIGELLDPVLDGLAPWIKTIAIFVDWFSSILKVFNGGLAEVQGILNFSAVWEAVNWTKPGFNVIDAIGDLIEAIFNPVAGLFEWASDLIPGLDGSKIISGDIEKQFIQGLNSIVSNFTSAFASGTNLVGDPTCYKTEYWDGGQLDDFHLISLEQKHFGTTSLKMIADGYGFVSWKMFRDAEGVGTFLNVTGGQKYKVEMWIRGKSTNTTATNQAFIQANITDSSGVNSIQFYQVTGTFKPSPTNFGKYTGIITIPNGYDRMDLMPMWHYLANSGDVMYIDDISVKDITEAQGIKDKLTDQVNATDTDLDNWLLSLANGSAVEEWQQWLADTLTGFVDSTPTDLDNWLLSLVTGGKVPLSSITNEEPNLVRDPTFRSPSTVADAPGFDIDPTMAHSETGNSAKVTCNGTKRSLTLGTFPVVSAQPVTVNVYAQWTGMIITPPAAPSAIRVVAESYKNGDLIETVTIASPPSDEIPINTIDWIALNAEYVATGADTVRILLEVDAKATAGNVWFSDVEVRKQITAVAPSGWISGLTNAFEAVSEFIQWVGSTILEALTGLPVVGWMFEDLYDSFNDLFNTANDAYANAGDAQDAADAANILAGDATPRVVFDAITPGGKNIATDPTMGTDKLWNDTANQSYAIANFGYWGLKCLEMTVLVPASFPRAYFIRDSHGDPAQLIVAPGDKFDFSCWIREKSGNTGTNRYMNLQVIFSDSNGILPNTNQTGTSKLPGVGTWQQLKIDVDVPAGYDTAAFHCYTSNTVAINDKFYIDTPVIRETTKPTSIMESIFGQKQVATTIIASAVPQISATKVDSGVFGVAQIPDLAQVKITGLDTSLDGKTPRDAFDAITPGGKNIATDPTMSTANLWSDSSGTGATYAIASGVGYWGTKSLELTVATPGSFPSAYFIRNSRGQSAALIVTPGDKFDFSCYIRRFSGNANTSVTLNLQVIFTDSNAVLTQTTQSGVAKTATTSWQQLSMDVVVPAGYNTATFRVYVNNNSVINDKYYIDTPTIRETTAPTNIAEAIFGQKQTAVTIQATAVPQLSATKIDSGVLGTAQIPSLDQGKITNLGTDLAAKLPRETFDAKTTAGNIASDPYMQTASLWNNTARESFAVANFGYWGFKSIEITTLQPTNLPRAYFIRNSSGNPAELIVTPGDKFDFSAYVRGLSGNSGGNKIAYLRVDFTDSTGVLPLTSQTSTGVVPGNTFFSKLDMDVVVPAGYDTAAFYGYHANTVTATHKYYWDTPTIRETTKPTSIMEAIFGQKQVAVTIQPTAVPQLSATKIDSGTFATAQIPTLAQSKVTNLTTDLGTVTTAASTAQTTANTANTAAGTAQTTANTANTAAGTAQTTANAATPRVIFDAKTPGGKNVATDPLMQTASLWSNTARESFAIANFGYWGFKSLEITTLQPSNLPRAYFIRDSNGNPAALIVTPGDKFDFKAYVRGLSSNSGGNKIAYIKVDFSDSTGVLSDTSQISTGVVPGNTLFSKLEMDVVVPAGYDTAAFYGYHPNTVTSTHKYYWDTPVILETTKPTSIMEAIFGQKQTATTIIPTAVPQLSATKIDSGTFADAQIPTLAQTKISSLVTDLAARLTAASSLNASNLSSGTLSTSLIGAGAIDGTKIAAGSISNSLIAGSGISASKMTTGVLPVAQVPNLDADKITTGTFTADRITDLSGQLENLINATQSANLVGDPGCSSTTYWAGLGTGVSIDTTVKNSGTASIKLIANGSSYRTVVLTRNAVGGASYARVSPNDTIDMALWLKGAVPNSSASAKAYMQFQWVDSAGFNPPQYSTSSYFIPNETTWQSWGFNASAPPGYDLCIPLLGWLNTAPNNETMYMDDAVVQNTTNITKLIDTIVTGLGGTGLTLTDLSNAVGNIPGGNIASAILATRVPDIDASKITSGTLSNAFIATGLDAAKLTTGTLPIARIGAAAITDSYIASGLSATKVTTGTLSTSVIGAGAIDGTKIASGSISNALIASGVDAAKLTTGTLPSARIAAGGIDNTQIASGVDAAKLTTGTLPTARIAAGSIADSQVASGLSASKVTTGTLSTSVIGAGAIDGTKIATGSIGNSLISSGVDASKITTGTLPVAQVPNLASSKITGLDASLNAINFTAVDTENLVSGSSFENGNPWPDATGVSVATDQFYGGTKSLKMNGCVGSNLTFPLSYEVKAGEQIFVEFWARRDSSFNHTTPGAPDGSRFRLARSNGSTFLSVYYTTNILTAANTWYRVTGVGTVPADIGTHMIVYIYTPPAGINGTVWIDEISVRRVKNGDVIADAAISNIKLVSDIDASKIASGTLGNSFIASGLDAAKLTTGTLPSARIGANAIGTSQIATGAITAAEIAAGAVGNAAIASGVDAAKLTTGTLPSARIGAGAIAGSQIATNAVTAANIAPLTITAAEILAGTIGNSQLASGLDAAKLTTGTLPTARIAAGSITGTQVAGNTVTAANIAPTTITAAEIASGAVGNTQIASGVDAAKLTTGTLPTARIGAASIAGSQMVSNTVTATQIAPLAVTAAELANSTITTGKIGSNQITTALINTNAVTANEIAASTITSTELGTNSVTTAKINTNAVTAVEIADGAVGATQIGANAVTDAKVATNALSQTKVVSLTTDMAARLTNSMFDTFSVGADNLISDASFEGTGVWPTAANVSGEISSDFANTGTNSLKQQPTSASARSAYLFRTASAPTGAITTLYYRPTQPGNIYYFSAMAYSDVANTAPTNQVRLYAYYRNSVTLAVTSPQVATTVSLVDGVWTPISCYFVVPANYDQWVPRLYSLAAGASGTDSIYWDDIQCREVTESSSINQKLFGSNDPTGNISMANIGAGAIDGTKIVSGAISNTLLATGIDAAKLTTGTMPIARIGTNAITATQIGAGVITSAELAAGSVGNTQIASGVDAAKLTTGTLPTARIAAGTLTGSQLATNTITATQINAGAVTNTEIASGVDAAKLTTGTLPTARIAAGSLTGTQLTANTITATQIGPLAITAAEIAASTITDAKMASGQSATKLTTGTLPIARIADGSVTDAKVPGLSNTWDNLVQGWFNDSETGRTTADIFDILRQSKRNQDELAAGLSALTASQSGSSSSGRTIDVQFTAAAIPTVFTKAYDTGAGNVAYNSGDGGYLAFTNNTGLEIFKYNVTSKPLLTDYHEMSILINRQVIDYFGSYNNRAVWFILRANSGFTEAVVCRMRGRTARFGYVTGNNWAAPTWFNSETTIEVGSYMTFKAGTTQAAPRVLQILANNVAKLTVTATSAIDSLTNSTHRFWGWGLEHDYNDAFNRSAWISRWIANDAYPPTIPGTGATMSRTATSLIGVSSGVNLIPASFFNSIEEASPDIAVDTATTKFTVSESGWYTFVARIKGGSSGVDNFEFLLYVDGVPWRYGGMDMTYGTASTSAAQVLEARFASWRVPLAGGSYVQLAYRSSTTRSNVLTSDAGGIESYFTCSKG